MPGGVLMRKIFLLLTVATFLCAVARAQDEQPSLGDVARQARSQKQQKDAQAAATPKVVPKIVGSNGQPSAQGAAQSNTGHVITEDELSSHVAAKSSATSKDAAKDSAKDRSKDSAPDQSTGDREAQAEQWKEQIQAQKDSIAQLQRQITEVSGSIHFVGGNCVENCEQWNQNQQRKQDQVESMKAELQAEQQHLEEMQDAARKQGFGSNVYDQ